MNIALSFSGCHRRGGVERIVYECAQFLAGRQHQVDVFCNEFEGPESSNLHFKPVEMTRHPWFWRGHSYYKNCSRAIVQSKYDVMNTHGCICPTGGVQWVQSVHAAWLERGRKIYPPLSLRAWKRRLNPLHPVLLKLEELHFRNRNYRKLIATTPEVRSDLIRLYDVPENDVEIIPNGFSPTEFNPENAALKRNSMRQLLGLNQDQLALLFVGNELERKGFRTILGAVKILNDVNIKIVAVGRPSVESVMNMAAEFGLQDQVLAKGLAVNVADYHAACDLMVLPTQYEAFCLAILESLGSGLPVITSDVAGARDAIVPGVNGQIVRDPNDADELAEVIGQLRDKQKRKALADASASSVSEYQWPKVLLRYEAVLMEHCRK